jgi:hypothetical protein
VQNCTNFSKIYGTILFMTARILLAGAFLAFLPPSAFAQSVFSFSVANVNNIPQLRFDGASFSCFSPNSHRYVREGKAIDVTLVSPPVGCNFAPSSFSYVAALDPLPAADYRVRVLAEGNPIPLGTFNFVWQGSASSAARVPALQLSGLMGFALIAVAIGMRATRQST